MTELNKALADILEIRARIAAGTPFRGYGPLAMSVTGLIGLATALLQSVLAAGLQSRAISSPPGWWRAFSASPWCGSRWGPLAPASFHPGHRHDQPGDRAIPARPPRPALSCRFSSTAIRAGQRLAAAGPVADLGQHRHLRLAAVRCRAASTLAGGWYFFPALPCLLLACQGHGFRPGRWACHS